jgi:hypothetical protein
VRVWLLLLAACAFAQASEFAYTIATPPGSRVEAPAVTRVGDWEVTVSFDELHCEVLCVYRNRGGRAPLFLPPAVAVKIYSGMRVSTLHFDPAHTRDHTARPLDRLEEPDEAAPARVAIASPVITVEALAARGAPPCPRTTVVPRTIAPLRI